MDDTNNPSGPDPAASPAADTTLIEANVPTAVELVAIDLVAAWRVTGTGHFPVDAWALKLEEAIKASIPSVPTA